MKTFSTILDLACGRGLDEEKQGPASKLSLGLSALLFSLIFASLWGAAAGSQIPALALANTYKVPSILLASVLSALPAGFLAWKLGSAPGRGVNLFLSSSIGVFGATLVLGATAPVLALYYHSSKWAGPILAQGSVILGTLAGIVLFIRALLTVSEKDKRGRLALPVGVFTTTLLAALMQMIVIWSPMLPERTIYDEGIDAVVKKVTPPTHAEAP